MVIAGAQEKLSDTKSSLAQAKQAQREAKILAERVSGDAEALAAEAPELAHLLKRSALPTGNQASVHLAGKEVQQLQVTRLRLKVLTTETLGAATKLPL